MRRRALGGTLVVAIVASLLGLATVPDVAAAALAPVQVVEGTNFTCALSPSGQAYCWGGNGHGTLGDGTTTDRTQPVAVQQGSANFISITAGATNACGLSSAGQAYCWGANDNGRLGDGTTADRTSPVAVQQGANTYVVITTGSGHTCGLTSAGAAYCWGYNGNGQLGDNSTTDRSSPVAVQQGGTVFTSLTAGGYHSCGLTSGGQTYCWGQNTAEGRLGDGTTTDRSTPGPVTQGGVTYISIVAGLTHTCGLSGAGRPTAGWQ